MNDEGFWNTITNVAVIYRKLWCPFRTGNKGKIYLIAHFFFFCIFHYILTYLKNPIFVTILAWFRSLVINSPVTLYTLSCRVRFHALLSSIDSLCFFASFPLIAFASELYRPLRHFSVAITRWWFVVQGHKVGKGATRSCRLHKGVDCGENLCIIFFPSPSLCIACPFSWHNHKNVDIVPLGL